MTQVFTTEGSVVPVTVLRAEPLSVTQVKSTRGADGYDAIQVATMPQKKERLSKSLLGHLKGAAYKVIREFRTQPGDLNVGATIPLDVFKEGDVVEVTGVSKGKGFQGGMKRHGMSGGWGQHGQKHSMREIGSIGATGPQKVNKGKRMPGRMGSDRITNKNVKIVGVDQENGLIYVKGAVPGKRGTVVEIRG